MLNRINSTYHFRFMKIKSALFFVGLLLLFACKEASKQDNSADRKDGFSEKPVKLEDSLLKEVLDGHDVGMARMGKISKYLKQIQAELDSMVKLPAKSINKDYQQALIDLQEDLNYAQFGMNEWMDKFALDTLSDKPELRIKYLENEKMIVGKVKENILSGLARADSLFQKK
jgi:hypothetical protein